MSIKIKNLETGKLIIVKNQDDLWNLKNTGQSYGFGNKYQKERDSEPTANFDLDKLDKIDQEEYVDTFAYDGNEEGSKQIPVNPTRDPYFNFSDDAEKAPESNGYNIFDDSDSDSFDLFGDDEIAQDEMGGSPDDADYMDTKEENPNYVGEIRSVTGARLEFKRQSADGTFTELWAYTIHKDAEAEYAIRRAILAGTEIDPNTNESDDGSQKVETKSLGNVQLIYITGLPQ